MKIAFFGESKSDDVTVKKIVERILNDEVEETDIRKRLIFRSSSHLDRNLDVVIRSIHFSSDAEFLVICSDSDDFPVHIAEHDKKENEKCRLCSLRKAVKRSLAKLSNVPNKRMLKVAIGVPVPALEAWLLFKTNPQVSENTWIKKLAGEKGIKYDRKTLKRELYGGEHISEDKRIEISLKAVERIAENNLLDDLETAFPLGFGSLSNEVKSWN
jgi:hypothetical protein